ncbi:NAD(P)-dependent alcohol dehydrogenase [Nocardia mikamii]|uniref:NAD(P)-dependent alcohol dehydrogenase n=1 Tax=Nocardia mikamii TaxID=508464 RepID=UPI0007A38628|nr:NAD(P)-dependent alcohol dehydrogenase [Nocardia mikamii]
MKALQYRRFGDGPEVVDVAVPAVGPGQLLLRVIAAGCCHSDLHIMAAPEHEYRYGSLPLTLGHEAAGVIAALGEGVSGFSVGDAVVVYGPWGCGVCRNCLQGKENYCTHPDGIRPPGIVVAGAMAEYLLIDHERHLMPLGDLHPVQAVALTDAGLTSYHAIKQSIPKLGAGSHALVIGAGGLGHVAIQILRAMSPTTVIAVDLSDDKLRFAGEIGAHHAVRGDVRAATAIRSLTNRLGVDAIFDFVGSQQTVELAGSVVATEGDITIVGVGKGRLLVGYRSLPFDACVRATFWGSRPDLAEVVELARAGHIRIEVETYSLNQAPLAYQRLEAGAVRGRAVIVLDTDSGNRP